MIYLKETKKNTKTLALWSLQGVVRMIVFFVHKELFEHGELKSAI